LNGRFDGLVPALLGEGGALGKGGHENAQIGGFSGKSLFKTLGEIGASGAGRL
jgi:hypothetical protein